MSFCFFCRHIAGGVSIYSISTIFSPFCFVLFRLVAVGCAVIDMVRGGSSAKNLGIVLISVTLMYTPSFSALVLPVGFSIWFLSPR